MVPAAVSVVIPALNSERFVGEAIESVLAQTTPAAEIIVVDDASDDLTREVAAGYPEVTLVRNEARRGCAGARNAGYRLATGDLVCFHDADDVMLPSKLEIQVGYLRAHPGTDVVIGSQEVFVEEGAELPFWHRDSPAGVMMPPESAGTRDGTNIHSMSMLLSREAFDRVGLFDERIGPAEDVDWMLRASEAGLEIARLEQVVVRRRVHPASATQDALAARRAILRAFKARVDRRRAARAAPR
jgi:glycosyltransferase involved in cell wall biosynthesis